MAIQLILGSFVFIIALQATRAEDSLSTLRCWKDSIYIGLSSEFLLSRSIELSEPEQLHFSGHAECYATVQKDGYSLTLFPPYNTCGTTVKINEDTYTYSNEIVFKTESSTIKIFSFHCKYDRKYIVSSEVALTPVIKTLNFVTERGKFEVGMGLYQRSDFNPKSMFGENPSILVGTPVYVSVDVTDVFEARDIVSTIESCYASDNDDRTTQKLYHSLIVSRCASVNDDSVHIISNGESMSSRYRFDMFRWRDNAEYIYLHCEVRVCNTSRETCHGVGSLCSGVTRRRPQGNLRRRRETMKTSLGENLDATGVITLGPMIAKKETELEAGVGSYDLFRSKTRKDQSFLQIFIYVAVAAAILIVGIIIAAFVVSRRRRQRKDVVDHQNRSKDAL